MAATHFHRILTDNMREFSPSSPLEQAGNATHDPSERERFAEWAVDFAPVPLYFPPMLNPLNSFRILLVKALKKILGGVSFRGKGRLLLLVCPRDREIEIDLAGYRFRCNLAEHTQRNIFLWDFDKKAVAFIRSRLRPGDTFVDVGANVGFFSLTASRIVGPTGRVISVEPNPSTFARLSRTVAENSIPNITMCNLGLGDSSATLSLYTGIAEDNDTASMLPYADGGKAVTVEVLPLDLLAEQLGLERIDYIKIDVDGFEHKVLAGAAKLLASGRIRHLQIEFSDVHLRMVGSSPEKLHEWITSHGFRDVDGTPSFSRECLIDRFFDFSGAPAPVTGATER